MSDDDRENGDEKARREAEAAEAERLAREQGKAGYKCPPVDSRFKKGVSPNPRGRPKMRPKAFSQRQLNSDVLSITFDEIPMTINGKRVRKSRHEALVLRLYADALKGDRWSTATVLKIARDATIDRARHSSFYIELEKMEEMSVTGGPKNDYLGVDYFLDILRKRSQKR